MFEFEKKVKPFVSLHVWPDGDTDFLVQDNKGDYYPFLRLLMPEGILVTILEDIAHKMREDIIADDEAGHVTWEDIGNGVLENRTNKTGQLE